MLPSCPCSLKQTWPRRTLHELKSHAHRNFTTKRGSSKPMRMCAQLCQQFSRCCIKGGSHYIEGGYGCLNFLIRTCAGFITARWSLLTPTTCPISRYGVFCAFACVYGWNRSQAVDKPFFTELMREETFAVRCSSLLPNQTNTHGFFALSFFVPTCFARSQ